jgi:hypothetical protein
MKKAFMVELTLMTRVEVDVPEDWENNGGALESIEDAACHRLHQHIAEGYSPICPENVTRIREDFECPVGFEEEI